MATTYQVIQPNGKNLKLSTGENSSRMATVEKLLSGWESYCERNWISSNYADVFCGENKVKRFLNGLSYFLLLGDTEGVVTDYKESMHGKREIPMSSCPSQIQDMVYGTGGVLHPPKEEEEAAFKMMLKSVDERLPAKKKSRQSSPRELRAKTLQSECGIISDIEYATVDTQNTFSYSGCRYKIDESVEEYLPKETSLGVIYDMDKIICVKGAGNKVSFYTADYHLIPENKIKIFSEST